MATFRSCKMSGKALNCNLIHEIGAIPGWGGPGAAVTGFASERAGLRFGS
jgi:hypothetical protein